MSRINFNTSFDNYKTEDLRGGLIYKQLHIYLREKYGYWDKYIPWNICDYIMDDKAENALKKINQYISNPNNILLHIIIPPSSIFYNNERFPFKRINILRKIDVINILKRLFPLGFPDIQIFQEILTMRWFDLRLLSLVCTRYNICFTFEDDVYNISTCFTGNFIMM